ncbi:MAG: 16S rRNA (cytosine(1402)-N(4))-methyltransferase RsmH [Patescibacteria group bacterium]
MSTTHVPVLLHEVIDGLGITDGDTVVDATVGGGGYMKAFCEKVGATGHVIGFDEDEAALLRAKEVCAHVSCKTTFVHENFRNMKDALANLGITTVNGIAFDLGVSSFQIEISGRGFSFLRDEPLAMTLAEDPTKRPFTAEDIVNTWEEHVIADVIFGYGEERYARRIAKAIVEIRIKNPIKTTGQLVEIVKNAVPARYTHGPIHPATRTFQALRIAVNDELGALSEGLLGAYEVLAPGKRMVVVAFHSLEDRIVKNFFRERAGEGGVLITKKPMTPTFEEQRNNPRSRSAKLRILQK